VAAGLAAVLGAAPRADAQPTVESAALSRAPTIDGTIGDGEWAEAAIVDQAFVQIEPDFGSDSPLRTVVRIGQTDTALYISFEALDPDADRAAAAVTERDGGLAADDSVSVALDTFGDARNGYYFRTNALGTQEDGRIADNGRTVDERWDAAWRSASQRRGDRWVAELEIPFAILRYPGEAQRDWRVNFIRTIPRRLETAVWAGPGETVWRVSSFGVLTGVRTGAAQADSWQFIPYGLAVFEDGRGPDYEAGIDVRWRPRSQVGLDFTLNPDFALVEADVEEINLTRFELRVPEKRPFFLEGNELFNQRINQFYSRRIGDIDWGAKASGKIGANDFAAIVASESLAQLGLAEQRAAFSIARLQRGLARGSNVGLLAANRRLAGEDAGSVGIDTTTFFTEKLGMTGQLLRVHGPTADGGLAWFVRPSFDTSTTHFHVRYQELDAGIRNDLNAVGFLTDDDRKEFDTNASRIFWPKSGVVERVRPMVNYNRYRSQAGVLRSWVLTSSLDVVFRNGWELALEDVEEFKLFEKEFRNERSVLTTTWNRRDGRSVWVYGGTGFNPPSTCATPCSFACHPCPRRADAAALGLRARFTIRGPRDRALGFLCSGTFSTGAKDLNRNRRCLPPPASACPARSTCPRSQPMDAHTCPVPCTRRSRCPAKAASPGRRSGRSSGYTRGRHTAHPH
jgi:hypothetical protein